MIGVEYLIEIREDGYRSNPAVLCLLCSKVVLKTYSLGVLTVLGTGVGVQLGKRPSDQCHT